MYAYLKIYVPIKIKLEIENVYLFINNYPGICQQKLFLFNFGQWRYCYNSNTQIAHPTFYN
jgi:hypothetical protein